MRLIAILVCTAACGATVAPRQAMVSPTQPPALGACLVREGDISLHLSPEQHEFEICVARVERDGDEEFEVEDCIEAGDLHALRRAAGWAD